MDYTALLTLLVNLCEERDAAVLAKLADDIDVVRKMYSDDYDMSRGSLTYGERPESEEHIRSALDALSAFCRANDEYHAA
tara:strand:- start:523 stop:762 length:240 start_codon:yes stop_codon:yes gene_type:complete